MPNAPFRLRAAIRAYHEGRATSRYVETMANACGWAVRPASRVRNWYPCVSPSGATRWIVV